MKIFYAVQATGNGHISRAIEILPVLQTYGEVDVFLSGSNYSLKSQLPIAYRSKGLSLAYDQDKGSIDVLKTLKNISIRKIWNEARFLPVEKYDVVINDFECITSIACKLKKVKSIHLGHQASFNSRNVPRPEKQDFIGEWVLSHYASGSENYGLHFKEYDTNIFNPIIRKSILFSDPSDKGHITIYLGQYATSVIVEAVKKISDYRFEIFCRDAKEISTIDNCKIIPISQDAFTTSLLTCHGIITGAGFETPAEALYLEKKLMILPLKGQYEQKCNAAALREFNVSIVDDFTVSFPEQFQNWLSNSNQQTIKLRRSTKDIIEAVIEGVSIKPLKQTQSDWQFQLPINHQRAVGN